MIAPTLNGLRVAGVRLFLLWKGAWVADCELDVDTVALAPTKGPATLLVGGAPMIGTVDPHASGTFLSKASARVVGGRGAWDQVVPRQDFFSDAGVLSTTVYAATGALVGETVVDLAPAVLGPHVVRSTGPASRVFGALEWFVDAKGITNVGPRLPAIQDTSLAIRDFDPGEQRVSFSSDALLLPGTRLVDPRFNGAIPVVRDVEQIFDRDGSRGFAWCSTAPVSRITTALENLVVETAGRTFLRAYRYRLVLYQGQRLALQAVNPQAGLPDLMPVTEWSGLAGASNVLAPSQEVFVAFDFTTPGSPQPIILGYASQGKPTSTTIDAIASLSLGPTAAAVAIAGGGTPVAREGDAVKIPGVMVTAPSGGGPCTVVVGAPGGTDLVGTITAGSLKASCG